MSTAAILVSGYLGSGKSTLVARLRESGHEAEEVGGLLSASAKAPMATRRVICVVDAANTAKLLDDDLVAPLLRRQAVTAGMIAVSRTDMADAAPLIARLAGLADAPVVAAPNGVIDEADLAALEPRPLGAPGAEDDLSAAFGHWRYEGAARLHHDMVEQLLTSRPPGLDRISGVVRTQKGGVEVQVAGRVRQTLALPAPAKSALDVVWRRSTASEADIDLWFAQAIADSNYRRGLFSYR